MAQRRLKIKTTPTWSDVLYRMDDQGCTLITTEDQYNANPEAPLQYHRWCWHIRVTTFKDFLHSVRCGSCDDKSEKCDIPMDVVKHLYESHNYKLLATRCPYGEYALPCICECGHYLLYSFKDLLMYGKKACCRCDNDIKPAWHVLKEICDQGRFKLITTKKEYETQLATLVHVRCLCGKRPMRTWNQLSSWVLCDSCLIYQCEQLAALIYSDAYPISHEYASPKLMITAILTEYGVKNKIAIERYIAIGKQLLKDGKADIADAFRQSIDKRVKSDREMLGSDDDD